ncbi:MAG: class I SAM-dependent methyltransferase [Candidatus Omnitrophica bacterium]|nr:class I SAM-dependent methyltransferase [Candidatus Omnitrophota bacterium]
MKTNLNNTLVSCPICGSSDYRILFHDYNRRDNINCSGTYVRCEECSLVYLRERPPWKEIVKLYSALDSDITANPGMIDIPALKAQLAKPIHKWKQFLRKVRFRPHSWPLESVPKGSKRLLDLGCGNGAKLVEFAQRGYDAWGVDVSGDAINVCRQILPEGHFIKGELRQVNLPSEYFDYIRIDNALEHVPNPKEVVKECHRLLKRRGRLLVYVPHGESFSMRFMKGDSISSWIPFHLLLFTRESLHRVLAEAGFKSIRIYGYYPTSWLPLSIMQRRMRKGKVSGLSYPSWLVFACYPFGWMFSKIGLAEELVGVGKK